MIKFRYAIDFSLIPGTTGQETLLQAKTLFEQLLSEGLNSLPQSLTAFEHRVLYRILTKMDFASNEFLEVDDADFSLIERAFSDSAKFRSERTRLIGQIVQYIEEAKNGR